MKLPVLCGHVHTFMQCYLQVHWGLCFDRLADALTMGAKAIVMPMAARSCKAQQLCIITVLCLGAHSVTVQLVQLDLR